MRIAPCPVLALALALGLAACSEVRWHKPATDEAALGKDLSACRMAAQDSVQRMYGPMRVPSSGGGQFGNAPIDPTPADRQMREQEAVDRCMREKGYSLVPAGK